MSEDPFQELLGLEDEFYKEGYDAGVADSAYAGMIEGKVFGIEKGYEKALELAKLHGRALVWQARLSNQSSDSSTLSSFSGALPSLEPLPSNSRLQKNIQSLLTITSKEDLLTDNSDEAVTEFDDKVAKAKAKAKIIANVAGEPINPNNSTNGGIEDAIGLNARH